MSMVRVSPLEVRVRTDLFAGLPRALRLAGDDIPVLEVARVRHESAAYRVGTGPRTCFEVVTPAARFALAYSHRDRRWRLEAVEQPDVERTMEVEPAVQALRPAA